MKTTAHKIFLTFLLLILGIATVFAQIKPEGKISGLLTDVKGKPMDYASVGLIKSADSTVVKGTLSNEAGAYAFDHVSAGTYIIKATVVGYKNAFSTSVKIDGAEVLTVPVIQLQQASQSLSTVTITASKPLIERKADRMVMNVENSVLAAGNSAMDILQRAPGVTIDKDDNISLKGKQGVTVMINDKLTYLSAAQLATLLRATDGTTIQSIELITNPSAKYDAAGNSGIINIKLKKNKQTGTNGSLTLGTGYGAYWKDNSTLTLNHKEGNLNIYGTFSHDDTKRLHDIGINRIVTDNTGNNTYFDQSSIMTEASHDNSYRLGADYSLSPKNTIGFLINGYDNTEGDNNSSRTNIGLQPNVINSYLLSPSQINQTYKDFALNLNEKYQIDTSGQELSVDLDYSKFRNNSNAQYNTFTFAPDGSMLAPPVYLLNQSPSIINIKTAKIDYAKPLNKMLKLEAGIKLSDVKTDNDLEAQNIINGAIVKNDTLSNHFVYTEKIDAAYINLNQTWKTTTLQAGLRAEYTSSIGDLTTTNQVQNRHYLDFFPSVFINHTINDKNEIGISYSRRIDRPGYDQLNPFVYYLDKYTYQKGNPFLNAQYTNNFELTYTYNKTINLSLGYSRTTDAIVELLLTDVSNQATYVTPRNLQTQNNYNISVNSPFTINKWWTGNVNVTGFYLGFKSDTLLGANLNNGKFAYQAKLMQTFQVAKSYKAELMGDYQSALVYGLFNIKPQYSVDAGISHSFWDKKGNLKLSMSDIFNTRRNDLTSNYQSNNINIMQKNESRITRLTFTYNFGNNKIKVNDHQSGADDLKGRVKGSN